MAIAPELAMTILKASVAGAGLALTAYGLTAIHAADILEAQVADLTAEYRKLKWAVNGDTPSSKLREIAARIDEKSQLPLPISIGFALTFFLYCVSSMSALSYLANPGDILASLIVPAFGIATLTLTASGLWIIWSVTSIIKNRFESLKRET